MCDKQMNTSQDIIIGEFIDSVIALKCVHSSFMRSLLHVPTAQSEAENSCQKPQEV